MIGYITLGAIVTGGKVIPSGQYWAGAPAVYVRDLTEKEIARITSTVKGYNSIALLHAEENDKSWETVEQELFDYEQRVRRNPNYYRRLDPEVTKAIKCFCFA